MTPRRVTKGARTRTALVDAAVVRFATSGYQRVSLSDIAGDAGVSPTAIYRYFEDKGSLFTAAVDADAEALVDVVRTRLRVDVGPALVDLLDLLTAGLVEAIEDHPLVARVLADRSSLTKRVLELPSVLELRAEVAALLELGQAEGVVRASLDPAAAALALEATVLNRVTELMTVGRDARDIFDDRWRAVVGLVEAALTP